MPASASISENCVAINIAGVVANPASNTVTPAWVNVSVSVSLILRPVMRLSIPIAIRIGSSLIFLSIFNNFKNPVAIRLTSSSSKFASCSSVVTAIPRISEPLIKAFNCFFDMLLSNFLIYFVLFIFSVSILTFMTALLKK